MLSWTPNISDRVHPFILHPVSRSSIYVCSFVSRSFNLLPSTLLLCLLSIQITCHTFLLSPSRILLVELGIHDFSFTRSAHLLSVEILVLWSDFRSWHCCIAVVSEVSRVLTMADCCSGAY